MRSERQRESDAVLHAATIGALALFCAVLRWYHYIGPAAGDESAWILCARRIFGLDAPGVSTIHPVYFSRPFWLVAIAAMPGVLDDASNLLPWSLAFAAANTVLIALAAETLFANRRAGWLAGLLYSVHPLAIQYDVLGIPDTLGMTIVLTAFLFIARFLIQERTIDLLLGASFGGLSIGFKAYFPIVAIPLFLTLVYHNNAVARPLKQLAIFSGVLLLVVLGSFYVKSRMPTQPGDWNLNVSERLIEKDGTNVLIHDAKSLLSNIAVRMGYLRHLTRDSGFLEASSIVFATVFFCIRAPKDPASCLVLLSFLSFLGFLMFCLNPSLPFVFVEMQRRYLTVVLPFACVMGGVVGAGILTQLQSGTLRKCVFAYIFAGAVCAAWMPNDARSMSNYGQFRIGCIIESARVVTAKKNRKMLISSDWAVKLPIALGPNNECVNYIPASTNDEIAYIIDAKDELPKSFYLYLPSMTDDETLKSLEQANLQAAIVELNVPHTSFRRFIGRLGKSLPGRFEGSLLYIEVVPEAEVELQSGA